MLDAQESRRAERTRPEALSELRAAYRREELVLTLVFHPEPGRIGETAVVPPARADRPEVIGRLRPLFGRAGGEPDERSLEDPHVSRVALEVGRQGGHLLLRRGATGARVQVDGRQLSDSLELDDDRLRRGVSLLLGHSVVLLLRLGMRAEGRAGAGAAALLGSSAYTCALQQQVLDAAGSGADVLILGETGTGKELVAGAIHRASAVSAGPLVSVNMSAIPAPLAPAELFGATRGAFTGADRARTGYFRQARGGTLFLDEIGATDPEVQPQLLRALQQREVQVVGGAIEGVDLRVVSATDARLDDDEGGFSAALRHRLGALEIRLLPLREHLEDVGELLWHFLAEELRALGRDGLFPGPDSHPREIATWADLFHRCLRYNWPGNVRELANRARQIALASEQRLTLPEQLYRALQRRDEAVDPEQPAPGGQRTMRDIGRDEFLAAWREAGFEVTAAARLLGVSRQAVYRRVRACGLRLASELSAREIQQGLEQTGNDLAALARRFEVSLVGLRTRVLQLGFGPGSG